MKYVCHDCGKEIPDDMDFCPHCGCMRSQASVYTDEGVPDMRCPSCGEAYRSGDAYCGKCGQKLPDAAAAPMAVPRLTRKGMVAVVLGLIPGFFNIFGLGHLVLRKYSRGAMFLVISLVLWYLNGWTYTSSSMLMLMLDVMVYFYSAMDVMRLAYMPEEK